MNYGIINYEVIGDGTPVLIIHGWGISKLTMKGAFEPIFAPQGFNTIHTRRKEPRKLTLNAVVMNCNLYTILIQSTDKPK